MTLISYHTERLNQQLIDDITPLLKLHYDEIAQYKHINVLDPDYTQYYRLQANDALRVYTVRDNGDLVGYSVYFIAPNAHYPGSIHANNDVLFVLPEYRGTTGRKLLQYAEAQLKLGGVDLIHMHMKVEHDKPALFKRMGYTHSENLYTKALR